MNPVEATAQELNLPKEQVEMVVNDFWKAIREQIFNLDTMLFGILLPIFRIDLQISVLYRHMKRLYESDINVSTKKVEKYNYYKSILKNLPYSDKNPKHKRYKVVYNPKRYGDNDW